MIAKPSPQKHLGKIVICTHYAIFPLEIQAVFEKKLNVRCFHADLGVGFRCFLKL